MKKLGSLSDLIDRQMEKLAARDWEGVPGLDASERQRREAAMATRTWPSIWGEFKNNAVQRWRDANDTMTDINTGMHNAGVNAFAALRRNAALAQAYNPLYLATPGGFSTGWAENDTQNKLDEIESWRKQNLGGYLDDRNAKVQGAMSRVGGEALGDLPFAAAFESVPGAKAVEKAWLRPSSVSPWYAKALGAVQTLGPVGLRAIRPDIAENLGPLKQVPAYSHLMSPAGIGAGLLYRAAGETFGRNPEAGYTAGEQVASHGASVARNFYENSMRGDIPLYPRIFGWSPSAKENFVKGLEHGVNTEIGRYKDPALKSVAKGYESALGRLPDEEAALARSSLPIDPVAGDVSGFFDAPLRGKLDYLMSTPWRAVDYATNSYARLKENLPGYVGARWGTLTPEERDAALNLAADGLFGAAIAGHDYDDIKAMPDEGWADRAGGAFDIGLRTMPWLYDTKKDVDTAADLVRSRAGLPARGASSAASAPGAQQVAQSPSPGVGNGMPDGHM